jgi:hypothetical protein
LNQKITLPPFLLAPSNTWPWLFLLESKIEIERGRVKERGEGFNLPSTFVTKYYILKIYVLFIFFIFQGNPFAITVDNLIPQNYQYPVTSLPNPATSLFNADVECLTDSSGSLG